MEKQLSRALVKYVVSILSPIIVIGLISHSYILSFEVSDIFSIWLYNSELLENVSTLQPSLIRHQSNDEVVNQKTAPNTFAWSSELLDWTIDREGSNLDQRPDVRACIWPEECSHRPYSASDDRIVDQLSLVVNNGSSADKIFKILPPAGNYYPVGQELFQTEACTINKCSITYDKEEADALIFENSDVMNEPPKYRRADQIWIARLLESPCHTFDKKLTRLYRGKHQFNWTASYRSDSDIVTPYSKFVPFKNKVAEFDSIKSETFKPKIKRPTDDIEISANHKNLIKGKDRKVAWFASNCYASNNRLEYAKELSKYIQVDIFGKCGNLTCDKWNQTGCLAMLNKHYKFYLSFENSNCHQYITEKLFENALGYNDLNHLLLPIVMGPPREDYEKLAPPGSFIHVNDFESPKELAEFLRLLDSDEDLYYSYFRWKKLGRFIDTKFMCRVCALLHESKDNSAGHKSYSDIKQWWTTCRKTSGNLDCCPKEK